MKISVKAVFAGIGVWLLSYLIIFIVIFGITLIYPIQNLVAAIGDYPTLFRFFSESFTFIIALLSGFVAARKAKQNELLHGFIIGFILFAIILMATIFVSEKYYYNNPFGFENIGLSLLYLVETMAGAYIQLRIKNKREQTSPIEDKIESLGQNREK